MATVIPASPSAIGGAFRFVSKDGSTSEFQIVAFVIDDSGSVEEIVTFPSIPKGATVERHNGVSGWTPFSLEV